MAFCRMLPEALVFTKTGKVHFRRDPDSAILFLSIFQGLARQGYSMQPIGYLCAFFSPFSPQKMLHVSRTGL